MIKFVYNLALFWGKNANFFAELFRQKYLKNHNIGPWSPWMLLARFVKVDLLNVPQLFQFTTTPPPVRTFFSTHVCKWLGGVEQGDQIGRIIVFWVTVYFGQFFKLQK
jgi:hypothetical protein